MGAITEFVGTMGGGVEVQRITIPETDLTGTTGTATTLYSITIPAGETWLAAFEGYTTGPSAMGNRPDIRVGSTVSQSVNNSWKIGVAALLTESTTLRGVRGSSSGANSVRGTLYLAQMEE